MIGLPANTRVWIVAGHTDMRKGFDGLAALVQTALSENPFSGHVFVFRGRRGDIIKVLWFDGQGLLLLSKRLERGRFVWPQASSGGVDARAVVDAARRHRLAYAGTHAPPGSGGLTAGPQSERLREEDCGTIRPCRRPISPLTPSKSCCASSKRATARWRCSS